MTAHAQTRTPVETWFWIFILADMSIFALFFGAYLWEFGIHREAFILDAEALSMPLGLINTLVLLTSSYVVVTAVHAHRRDDLTETRRRLAWALTGAAAFAVIKLTEYAFEIANGHSLTSSTFFMYYFVLTGLHLMHVAIGASLLAVWFRSLHKNAAACSREWAESAAGYWHMVDLLWLLIFSFLYIGSHG